MRLSIVIVLFQTSTTNMCIKGQHITYLFLHFLAFIFASEDCSRFVQALSKNDIFLNGRKQLATELMKNNATAIDFVNAMDSTNVTAGDKYQCGNTR